MPADRLLVWQVKEGWGPLCHFLGLPEPEEAFPNVNDTQEMLGRIVMMRRILLGTWAINALGAGLALYYFLY